MAQPDLESALFALADSMEWPRTPSFRATRRPRLPRGRWALVLAAAAILVLGGVAVAGGRLLRSVEIQRVPHLVSPSVSPAADPLRLGDRYPTVADAEQAAGFHVDVPSELGVPAEVRVRRQSTVIVTLVYAPAGAIPPSSVDPSVGLLVSEYRGSGDTRFVQKLVGPDTKVVPVTVNGASGVWLEGSPHQMFLAGQPDDLRLATNTLLWETGSMTYRLEATISEADALRIAGTLR